MSKILNYIKKIFNQDVFEDGYVYIIFDNTEYTENPDKYSEGVFAWYEDGTLLISLQFQINNGGDPLVFNKFLLKEKEISEVI